MAGKATNFYEGLDLFLRMEDEVATIADYIHDQLSTAMDFIYHKNLSKEFNDFVKEQRGDVH